MWLCHAAQGTPDLKEFGLLIDKLMNLVVPVIIGLHIDSVFSAPFSGPQSAVLAVRYTLGP